MADDSGNNQVASSKIKELEQSVDDLRRKLGAMIDQQRAARTQVLLATLAIILVILVFGWNTYSTMRQNLAVEKFETIIEKKRPEFQARAEQLLNRAVKEIVPVYQELALERVREMGPVLREQAQEEFSHLPEQISSDLDEMLHKVLANVQTRVQEQLKAKFPFAAEKDPNELFAPMLDRMRAHAEQFDIETRTIVANEEQRAKNVLVKFNVPDVEAEEKFDLEKQLIHQLLMYADYELHVAGTDEALDLDALRTGNFSFNN